MKEIPNRRNQSMSIDKNIKGTGRTNAATLKHIANFDKNNCLLFFFIY